MRIQTHKLWLKISSLAIMAYAILFFLGSIDMLQNPVELVLDLSNWPIDGLQNYNAQTTVFLSAILGGVLLGWAVLILMLVPIYDKEPEKIRKAVLMGFLSWFAFDSLGCIFAGNHTNAISNIILLFVLIGPLWRKAKA